MILLSNRELEPYFVDFHRETVLFRQGGKYPAPLRGRRIDEGFAVVREFARTFGT